MKKTKKEQYKEQVKSIVESSESLYEIAKKYETFKQNQKILKRIPKGDYRDLFGCVAFDKIEKYISEIKEVPLSRLVYITEGLKLAWDFRDEWNSCVPHYYVADEKMYSFLNMAIARLSKVYSLSHPDMIEASELLLVSTQMWKRNFVVNEVDERLKRLTDDFNPEIIFRLPCVERHMSRKAFEKGDYSLDPYGVYL